MKTAIEELKAKALEQITIAKQREANDQDYTCNRIRYYAYVDAIAIVTGKTAADVNDELFGNQKWIVRVEALNRKDQNYAGSFFEKEFDNKEEAIEYFDSIDIKQHQYEMCEADRRKLICNKMLYNANGDIDRNEQAE